MCLSNELLSPYDGIDGYLRMTSSACCPGELEQAISLFLENTLQLGGNESADSLSLLALPCRVQQGYASSENTFQVWETSNK